MNTTHQKTSRLLALVLTALMAFGLLTPASALETKPYDLAEWVCEHEAGRNPEKCEECAKEWKTLYGDTKPVVAPGEKELKEVPLTTSDEALAQASSILTKPAASTKTEEKSKPAAPAEEKLVEKVLPPTDTQDATEPSKPGEPAKDEQTEQQPLAAAKILVQDLTADIKDLDTTDDTTDKTDKTKLTDTSDEDTTDKTSVDSTDLDETEKDTEKSDEINNTDTSDESDETIDSDNTDASDETENTDESDVTDETDTSGGTSETEGSELDAPDGSTGDPSADDTSDGGAQQDNPPTTEEITPPIAAIPLEIVGITYSPAEPKVGNSITLSATLEGIGDTAPQGSVYFVIGEMSATGTINGDAATATWQPMQPGDVQISAVYAPADADIYSAGASQSIDVTVEEEAPGEEAESTDNSQALPAPGEEIGDQAESGIMTLAAALPQSLNNATVVTVGTYVYSGQAQTPALQVTLNGKELAFNKDYTFYALANNTNAGSASFTVMGINGYTGTKAGTFAIQPAGASNWTVVLDQTTFTADGTEKKPAVQSVTGLNGEAIADYTGPVYPSNPVTAGNYTVTLTAKDGTNYSGTATAAYTIVDGSTPITLTDSTTAVTWQAPSYVDNNVNYYVSASGSASPTASVRIKANGVTLTPGVDFEIAYTPLAGQTGAFTATISGKGNYDGSLSAYAYTVVVPATTSFTLTVQPASFTYTGVAHTPTVIVRDASNTIVVAANYVLTYENNINAGTATVTATGAGKYDGVSGNATFTIVKRPVQMRLNSSVSGTNLILSAQISGTINLQNDVSFSITMGGQTQTATAPVNEYGTATWVVPMTSSTFTATATHPGDDNHSNSSASTSSSVRTPAVSISVTESGLNGEYATIYVVVNGGLNQPIPTGTIVLRLDGEELTRLTLNNGRATHTIWSQPILGKRQEVFAEYLGDGYYAYAVSKSVPIWSSDKLIPAITLKTSVGSGSNPTKLTATVTSNRWFAQPTGWVSFFNGDKLLGTVNLDRYGEAVFSWKSVPNGTHTVYAVYNGDSLYRGATATAKINKRGSSSNQGGGTSTNTNTNTQTSARKDSDVLLYDANGIVQHTYNTASMSVSNGVLPLDTPRSMEFYSYGIMLPRLRTLNTTNGYFNFATPSFNIRLPFSFASGVDNLSDYLRQKGLTDSDVEVRVSVREIHDSSLESSFVKNNAEGTVLRSAYRVEIALYDSKGVKQDFEPASMTSPIEFLLPITGSTGIAEGYDEQSRTFFSTPAEFSDGAVSISVAQNGIYLVGQ